MRNFKEEIPDKPQLCFVSRYRDHTLIYLIHQTDPRKKAHFQTWKVCGEPTRQCSAREFAVMQPAAIFSAYSVLRNEN